MTRLGPRSWLLLALIPGSFAAAADPTWSTRTAMSPARRTAAVAAVGDRIYVIGGDTAFGSGVTGIVHAYVPATDSWVTTYTSMPTPRSYINNMAAVVNGVIYVFGGYNGTATVYDTVEAFNTATGTWSTKAPMPTPRADAATAVLGGTIYVIAGWN